VVHAPAAAGGVGPAPAIRDRPGTGTVVHLLGRFEITRDGSPVDVPASTHRLVAFLALRGGPVERSQVASCLWLDKSEERAHANLRSSLWRLRHQEMPLVATAVTSLSLLSDVSVDLHALLARARQLITENVPVDLSTVDVAALGADLLPAWYDDFVELERERFRQTRLHALEALSRRSARAGAFAEAVDAGLAAVSVDPMRESAHRVVIEAHLAEGNQSDALLQFRRLATILHQQLGIRPSQRTCDLVAARPKDNGGPVARLGQQRGGWHDSIGVARQPSVRASSR